MINTQAFLPRIEISLSKIRDNARMLSQIYGKKGISLMGVTKAVQGEPAIANAMIRGGINFIADSHIENIKRMKIAGVSARFVLLRTPLSQTETIVKNADISLNTEMETLKLLSFHAKEQNKSHQIIIMVEMGDLREGVLPCHLSRFIREVLHLSNIKIIGLGCNLACYGGVKPDRKNMQKLSELADGIERDFHLQLEIISGGNSANYEWYESSAEIGRINNLRLGESILLGCETISRKTITGLHSQAFQLFAEVIESKKKPSLPTGEISQDAFGKVPTFENRGIHQRAIIALGRQDTRVSGLKPNGNLTVLGASSDHIILDTGEKVFRVGDEVKFDLGYGSMLGAMTSPFIQKLFIDDFGQKANTPPTQPTVC